MLHCAFNDLFQPIPGMIVVEIADISKKHLFHFPAYFHHWNSESWRLEPNFVKRYMSYLFAKECRCKYIIFQSDFYRLKKEGFDFRTLSQFSSVYIASCWGFLSNRNFSLFKPADCLQNKIDSVKYLLEAVLKLLNKFFKHDLAASNL